MQHVALFFGVALISSGACLRHPRKFGRVSAASGPPRSGQGATDAPVSFVTEENAAPEEDPVLEVWFAQGLKSSWVSKCAGTMQVNEASQLPSGMVVEMCASLGPAGAAEAATGEDTPRPCFDLADSLKAAFAEQDLIGWCDKAFDLFQTQFSKRCRSESCRGSKVLHCDRGCQKFALQQLDRELLAATRTLSSVEREGLAATASGEMRASEDRAKVSIAWSELKRLEKRYANARRDYKVLADSKAYEKIGGTGAGTRANRFGVDEEELRVERVARKLHFVEAGREHAAAERDEVESEIEKLEAQMKTLTAKEAVELRNQRNAYRSALDRLLEAGAFEREAAEAAKQEEDAWHVSRQLGPNRPTVNASVVEAREEDGGSRGKKDRVDISGFGIGERSIARLGQLRDELRDRARELEADDESLSGAKIREEQIEEPAENATRAWVSAVRPLATAGRWAEVLKMTNQGLAKGTFAVPAWAEPLRQRLARECEAVERYARRRQTARVRAESAKHEAALEAVELRRLEHEMQQSEVKLVMAEQEVERRGQEAMALTTELKQLEAEISSEDRGGLGPRVAAEKLQLRGQGRNLGTPEHPSKQGRIEQIAQLRTWFGKLQTRVNATTESKSEVEFQLRHLKVDETVRAERLAEAHRRQNATQYKLSVTAVALRQAAKLEVESLAAVKGTWAEIDHEETRSMAKLRSEQKSLGIALRASRRACAAAAAAVKELSALGESGQVKREDVTESSSSGSSSDRTAGTAFDHRVATVVPAGSSSGSELKTTEVLEEPEASATFLTAESVEAEVNVTTHQLQGELLSVRRSFNLQLKALERLHQDLVLARRKDDQALKSFRKRRWLLRETLRSLSQHEEQRRTQEEGALSSDAQLLARHISRLGNFLRTAEAKYENSNDKLIREVATDQAKLFALSEEKSKADQTIDELQEERALLRDAQMATPPGRQRPAVGEAEVLS